MKKLNHLLSRILAGAHIARISDEQQEVIFSSITINDILYSDKKLVFKICQN